MINSKQNIALIDNDDSFTYNLVQLIEQAGANVEVISHDKVTNAKIEKFQKIILSPGADLPKYYPNMRIILEKFHDTKCILGVCLGMQAIAEFFGCSLVNLSKPFHGISSKVTISFKDKLFQDFPEVIEVGRYHSWVIDPKNIPNDILITSISEENHIMSITHKKYDVCGVQFHPESIMTPHGSQLIKSWIDDRKF